MHRDSYLTSQPTSAIKMVFLVLKLQSVGTRYFQGLVMGFAIALAILRASAIGCADDRRRIIRVKFLERCASYLSTSYAHLIVLHGLLRFATNYFFNQKFCQNMRCLFKR